MDTTVDYHVFYFCHSDTFEHGIIFPILWQLIYVHRRSRLLLVQQSLQPYQTCAGKTEIFRCRELILASIGYHFAYIREFFWSLCCCWMVNTQYCHPQEINLVTGATHQNVRNTQVSLRDCVIYCDFMLERTGPQ